MLRLWLAVCALAIAASVARADISPAWSDDQLAQFSSAIVSGRVIDVSVGRDAQIGAIYTYVTLAVDEALKGDVPERSIVIKQLGGLIGDAGLAVAEQAVFSRGEEVLVFLETRPRDGTLYTTALWQGKWTLGRDRVTGEPVAERQSPEGADRGALRGAAQRRTLSAFTTRLRASDTRSGPRRFVAEPPAEELRFAASQSTDGAAFTFLGPFRWNQFDTNTPIPLDVQSGGNSTLAGGGVSELNRAMTIWRTPTGLRFSTGGISSRCFGTGGGTGRISIVFLDPCGEISDSGGTLAIGGASYTLSGGRTVNGIAFGRAVDGYIVNNNNATALRFMQNSNCFASVNTHEIGHVLGLGHSLDTTAIMYASISFTICSAAPIPISADDIAGIRTIYPPAAAGSAPGAPTGLVSSASGSTVVLAWVAPAIGGAPTGYVIEAGSSTGLADLASFNTHTTATSFLTSGVPAGVYFIRVRAANGSGTSPPSNQSTLIVSGGCTTAPGAPGSLFITSNSGGTVILAWKEAPGSPTTYIGEAGSAPGLSNLANVDLGGTATTVSVVGVARGTYFVRVRGRNACGTSAPSNEMMVIVP